MPIASASGPASAIETGISEMLTKKSSEETRPSRCGGTRRWSSVPQITIGAEKKIPITKPATTICHTASACATTRNGSPAIPHSAVITVR